MKSKGNETFPTNIVTEIVSQHVHVESVVVKDSLLMRVRRKILGF